MALSIVNKHRLEWSFTDISLSDKQWLVNFLRFGMIPFLALVLTHFISYGKMPFSTNYQFPLIAFGMVLLYGTVICETNRVVYKYQAKSMSLTNGVLKFVRDQLLATLISTTAVFSVLYVTQLAIFQSNPSLQHYLGYLMVLLGISSLGTGAYLIFDIHAWSRKKVKNGSGTYLIKAGSKELKIEGSQIAYFIWENGVGVLRTRGGDCITTNYSSLNEIERLLKSPDFFRVSRRFLVNHASVRSFKRDENGKLRVLIESGSQTQSIEVSRHKNKSFRKWFKDSVAEE